MGYFNEKKNLLNEKEDTISEISEDELIKKLKSEDNNGSDDIDRGNMNGLSACANIFYALILPFTCCSGFTNVNEKEEVIVQSYGQYVETITKPGLHWNFPNDLTFNKISTKLDSIDLNKMKIIDSCGNPIDVSAIVVYKVVNSKKALFNVANYKYFIIDQSQAVIRQVVSKYPYETNDENTPSLKKENVEIQQKLRKVLQEKVAVAGIYIRSVTLNEISYAVEIASSMLKKQQAKAIVDAREIILNGTIGLAVGAAEAVEEHGITMSDNQKAQLVSNILTVALSDKDAQPTVQL